MIKTFPYLGTKFRFLDLLYKNLPFQKIENLIEPFAGSSVFSINFPFENIEKVLNDKDVNVYRILKTFQTGSFEKYEKVLNEVKERFGDIKNSKENFYNFRNYFNRNFWKNDSELEGYYLSILASSCINSFLRFGPNGMNSCYGNRLLKVDELSFEKFKDIKILNCDWKETIEFSNDNTLWFLDPPYENRINSYTFKTFEDK